MIQSGNKQQNQMFLDTPFVPISRITSSRPFNSNMSAYRSLFLITQYLFLPCFIWSNQKTTEKEMYI